MHMYVFYMQYAYTCTCTCTCMFICGVSLTAIRHWQDWWLGEERSSHIIHTQLWTNAKTGVHASWHVHTSSSCVPYHAPCILSFSLTCYLNVMHIIYMCGFLVFFSSICLLLAPSSIRTLALSLLPSAVPSHSSSRSLTQVARFSPSPLILPSLHPLLSWIPGEYSTRIYPN